MEQAASCFVYAFFPGWRKRFC